MKLGIAAESNPDILVCLELCRKIFSPNSRVPSLLRFSNDTKICKTSHIEKIAKHFTLLKTPPKVLIIMTDSDGDNSTLTKIKSVISKVEFICPVIVAICNDKIEDWLIDDETALIKVFGSLGNRSIESGKRLDQLIGDYRPNEDHGRIYTEIAKNVELTNIKNQSLRDFICDLKREKRRLEPKKEIAETRAKANPKVSRQESLALRSRKPMPRQRRYRK